MNKSELIDQIAESADISKTAASRALDATINAVTGSLKNGESVALVGFGTFLVRERAARAAGEIRKPAQPFKLQRQKSRPLRQVRRLKTP